jgi:dihydroorotate dehydrogenase electron transfer subunit
MLQVAEGFYPFLRRPMCFERILPDAVTILYRVVGEGTRLLSRFLPGQVISVHGPLGRAFPINTTIARHIIVAGGMGVATFPALVEALIRLGAKVPEVVLGARTRELLLDEEEFREMGCPVHVATDDGSKGEKAFASRLLENLTPGPGTCVYACGPMAMLKATAQIALSAGADCLVSLEAHMACGDGVCLGCAVEALCEKEGEKMVRVCVDGPVFDARIINWDASSSGHDS